MCRRNSFLAVRKTIKRRGLLCSDEHSLEILLLVSCCCGLQIMYAD